jgi:hypothetical protein
MRVASIHSFGFVFQNSGFYFQISGFYIQISDLLCQVVAVVVAASQRRQAIIRNALGLKSLYLQHNTHDQQDRQSKRASEHGVR